jgi:hypothetical protein
MAEALSDKQEKFAQSIAVGEFDYNWMAYEKHYDCSKMSKNAIYVEACKLQQNPKVSLRIKELQEATTKRNQVTLDEVLNEMANWLRFNTKSIFNKDGTMKSLHEMTDEESSSIASYEVVELFDTIDKEKTHIGYLKKVRLLDKRAVAEMFLKKFGAFITKLVVDTEDLSHIKDLLDGIKK